MSSKSRRVDGEVVLDEDEDEGSGGCIIPLEGVRCGLLRLSELRPEGRPDDCAALLLGDIELRRALLSAVSLISISSFSTLFFQRSLPPAFV